MRKKLAFIFYRLILIINFLVFKICKKNFRYYLYDYLRSDSYSTVICDDFKIKLFTPSSVSKSRAERFLSKEPWTIKWIDRFDLSKKDKIIFWDIGANISSFSIYAAKKYKDIEVHAFEPSTSNLVLLSKNVSLNNLTNKININPYALNDKVNQFLPMNEKNFIEGGARNSFGINHDSSGKHFKTNTSYNIFGTSINYLIDNNILKIPNYIKLDVDGIEHLILEGANNILKNKDIKSICVEIDESSFENSNRALKILKDNGFEESFKFSVSKKYIMDFNYIFDRK